MRSCYLGVFYVILGFNILCTIKYHIYNLDLDYLFKLYLCVLVTLQMFFNFGNGFLFTGFQSWTVLGDYRLLKDIFLVLV